VSAPTTKPVARIVPRAGFGAAGAELSERPLSIAYFGASVTAQKEGYRPLLHERLRSRFGQDHDSVFAAIGGVDIVSAVFLVDEFVVRHDPDLCLIEFTSVEPRSGDRVAQAEAAMDGAVAKLRRAGCRPCLLHLARRDWRGINGNLLDAFERVAERHEIPSIDLTDTLFEQTAVQIFRDDVHTTSTGAQLIAELNDQAIGSIAIDDPRTEGGEEMPDPVGDDLRDAHAIPVGAEDAEGPAEMLLFRLQRPYLELPAASSIRRRFADRLAGLVLLVGPESGELEIVNRSGRQRLMTWDEYCFYERYTALVFDRPCELGEVSIELTDTVPDYASCRRPVEPPEHRTAKVIGYLVLPE
jgi:hypothetical protein